MGSRCSAASHEQPLHVTSRKIITVRNRQKQNVAPILSRAERVLAKLVLGRLLGSAACPGVPALRLSVTDPRTSANVTNALRLFPQTHTRKHLLRGSFRAEDQFSSLDSDWTPTSSSLDMWHISVSISRGVPSSTYTQSVLMLSSGSKPSDSFMGVISHCSPLSKQQSHRRLAGITSTLETTSVLILDSLRGCFFLLKKCRALNLPNYSHFSYEGEQKWRLETADTKQE